MSNLRDTILAEEELVASKRRFGLFSQAPPIAVGDDGEYKKLVRTVSLIQTFEAKMESQSQKLLTCLQVVAGAGP